MSKDDEQVLVFPHCGLPRLGEFPGLATSTEAWTAFVCDVLPNCRFMRRGDVEDDPTMQQVIPYVVCRWHNKVLVYNRGVKGGEKRLADKWSIGIGGHINLIDEHKSRIDTIRAAAYRELAEELGPISAVPVLHYVGVLKTDANEVDHVHTGVVFIAYFNTQMVFTGSEEIERHKWLSIDELKNYDLESWSEVVRDHLVKEEE